MARFSHLVPKVTHALWITGFLIAFLFYGGMGAGFVFVTIKHHQFTIRRGLDILLFAFMLRMLYYGFRRIVLKRSE